MAIQLPNPGLGDGQTGDNEYVMWTKVKDNFSNQAHAASRIVGTATGNVMAVGAFGFGGDSKSSHSVVANAATDLTRAQLGVTRTVTYSDTAAAGFGTGISFPTFRNAVHQVVGSAYSNRLIHVMVEDVTQQGTERGVSFNLIYTEGNTTKEEGTGYLVASSPVLKMQHGSFEKVHEAEQLDIEVKNNKTGVYEITGTTGLRENDGWNLKPPKDVNGNVLCICEATESNGVITLKTYKKKFDFETVSIVADYEQPTDIPEGATVMLRFNDLPQEQLDEPIE